ncbi:MAG: TetR/AcrR family transcriptional regulator [Cyanobacteria bacterium J06621_11]
MRAGKVIGTLNQLFFPLSQMQQSNFMEPGPIEPSRPSARKIGRPSQGKSAEKAQTILSGALEVFTTQGYAAATMSSLAIAAGVSKPTLYSYFESKEGLFVALIQHLVSDNPLSEEVLSEAIRLKRPPEQVLSQMGTSVLENFAVKKPMLTLFRLMIGESERFPMLTRTFVREVQKPLLENVAAYLAAQPHLFYSDPMVAARMFVGPIVHYTMTQYVMHGDDILPMDRDHMVQELVKLVVQSGSPHAQLTTTDEGMV